MKPSIKLLLLKTFFFSLSMFHSLQAEDVWNGEEYRENASLQYQWATKYIEKLHLKGDETILDIGCGDGKVTAALSLAVPNGQVIGIDSSFHMIKTANTILQDHPTVKNLSFLIHNATQIPFENKFDYVVSFSCLHWIAELDAVMQGIDKSLKQSGKFFLYFAPDFGKNRFDHALEDVMKKPRWKTYFEDFSSSFHLFTPDDVVSSLKKASLSLTRKKIVTIDEVFLEELDFINWIKAWLPHLKSLPVKLHDSFIKELLVIYFSSHPKENDGSCHFIDYWIEIEGVKLPSKKIENSK